MINPCLEAETYFSDWKGFEIMYHVSTMTNAEQHRRLVLHKIEDNYLLSKDWK